jgi:hypothetical protein
MLSALGIALLAVYLCGAPVAFVVVVIANSGIDEDGWKAFVWAAFWPILLPIAWICWIKQI